MLKKMILLKADAYLVIVNDQEKRSKILKRKKNEKPVSKIEFSAAYFEDFEKDSNQLI